MLTDLLTGLGGFHSVDPSERGRCSLLSCRRRLGPHVCLSGFGSGCCPGWAPSMGSGHCTLRKFLSLCPKHPPSRRSFPGLGQTRGPASTPSPVFLLSALCSFGCGSGFCIAPNVCSCQDGEQGASCPGNRGRAVAHGKNTEVTCQTQGTVS